MNVTEDKLKFVDKKDFPVKYTGYAFPILRGKRLWAREPVLEHESYTVSFTGGNKNPQIWICHASVLEEIKEIKRRR